MSSKPVWSLVDRIARAIAHHEGFFVTALEASRRKIKWPTVSRRLRNPGNLVRWAAYVNGQLVQYPRVPIIGSDGIKRFYVDFGGEVEVKQKDGTVKKVLLAGEEEGWRCLKVLVQKYIDGKYTGGKPPTLIEMMNKYAPSADANDPDVYAKFIAKRAEIPLDVPLIEIQKKEQV